MPSSLSLSQTHRMECSLALFIHCLFPPPAQEGKRRLGAWLHPWYSKANRTYCHFLIQFPILMRVTEELSKCSSLLSIKRLNISFRAADATLLLVILAYLQDPWTPHMDSHFYHIFEQKHLLTLPWKEIQWIEKWFLVNSKERHC